MYLMVVIFYLFEVYDKKDRQRSFLLFFYFINCIYYNGDDMFSMQDILYVAHVLGISFDKFTPMDLLEGVNIEAEHGMVHPETNVTNDNLITTSKIALAHLNEFPNYYNKEYGLKVFEDFLQSKLNGA